VAEIAAVVAVFEMVLAVVEQIVAEEKIAVEEQTVVEIEAVQISFAVAAIVRRSVDQEFVGVVSIFDLQIG